MIISASRRTDIPACFSQWLLNRFREGFVYVRNPMNAHQVSKVRLDPEVVDGIVFWTKDPTPLLDKLDAFRDYMYYFQFTLNSYGPDAECGVPGKDKVLVPAFQRLSDQLGPERVIWRYDPIFLSKDYTRDYHIHSFEKLAKRLAPYTRQCTISFLDLYSRTEKNLAPLGLQPFPPEEQDAVAKAIAEIAHSWGLRVAACAERAGLEKYGIEHAKCIDGQLFEKLLHCRLDTKKDKNQRQECGCVESIDIGAYNTCRNGCRYCYANFNEKAVGTNWGKHHPDFPLLIGEPGPEDKVTERKMVSCREDQLRLEW